MIYAIINSDEKTERNIADKKSGENMKIKYYSSDKKSDKKTSDYLAELEAAPEDKKITGCKFCRNWWNSDRKNYIYMSDITTPTNYASDNNLDIDGCIGISLDDKPVLQLELDHPIDSCMTLIKIENCPFCGTDLLQLKKHTELQPDIFVNSDKKSDTLDR